MNKKILGFTASAVAVASLVGGGTFANWTDEASINDMTQGAGHLRLSLADQDNDGAPAKFTKVKHAPGESSETRVWVSSVDGESVPDGRLFLSFSGVEDLEDDLNCTTNSEAIAEGGTCDNPGEFDEQAEVIMDVYPAYEVELLPANTQCDGYAKNTLGLTPTKITTTLEDFLSHDGTVNPAYDLGVASPGEGICTKITIKLTDLGPGGANNASQGDYVNFDADFELVQE